MAKNDRNPISKALQALSWLIEHSSGPVGVREAAAALRIAPSSAHRILAALARQGFVRKEPVSGRYVLGLELIRLAALALNRGSARESALPHMRKLAEQCNETTVLGLYSCSRQQMMLAASCESSQPLRYVIEMNKWLPIHTGAAGHAILAFINEQERSTIIKRAPVAASKKVASAARRLEEGLCEIRAQGYAKSHGSPIAGAVVLAAPIFLAGEVIGDVCIMIPDHRFSLSSEARLARMLTACTQRITGQLEAPSTRRKSRTRSDFALSPVVEAAA